MIRRAMVNMRHIGVRLAAAMFIASLALMLGACTQAQHGPHYVYPDVTAAVESSYNEQYAILFSPPGSLLPEDLVEAVSRGRRDGRINSALHLESTQDDKAWFSSVIVLGFHNDEALALWRMESESLLAPPVEFHIVNRLHAILSAGR